MVVKIEFLSNINIQATKVRCGSLESDVVISHTKNSLGNFLADMDNCKAIAYKVHQQQVISNNE